MIVAEIVFGLRAAPRAGMTLAELQARRFLSYLPSSVHGVPPVLLLASEQATPASPFWCAR